MFHPERGFPLSEVTPPEPEFDWQSGEIPESELSVSFVASGGPGGQHANKTATKAVLRWNLGSSAMLSAEQKEAVRAYAGSRITKGDEIVIASSVHKSQSQNREEALGNLNELIRAALKPKKKRKPTRKSKGTKAKERKQREGDKRKREARKKPQRGNDW